MNLEKVIFGFFTILACTLNFGFFIGDLDRPELHHPFELFAAIVVNLIVTVLKFGDRTQLGATHLATSLVASLQLLSASMVKLSLWFVVPGSAPRPPRYGTTFAACIGVGSCGGPIWESSIQPVAPPLVAFHCQTST